MEGMAIGTAPTIRTWSKITVLTIGLCALTAACSGRQKPPEDASRLKPRPQGDRPYYQGTRQQQQDIAKLIERLSDPNPRTRYETVSKISRYGEPAIPQLVGALKHSDPDIRTTAAFGLGMMKDPRAYDALAAALGDPSEQVRFEAATALVRNRDGRGLSLLVNGLESEDPRVRMQCIRILKKNTGETFDYKPDGRPEDRAAAVARWRAWIQTRQHKRGRI